MFNVYVRACLFISIFLRLPSIAVQVQIDLFADFCFCSPSYDTRYMVCDLSVRTRSVGVLNTVWLPPPPPPPPFVYTRSRRKKTLAFISFIYVEILHEVYRFNITVICVCALTCFMFSSSFYCNAKNYFYRSFYTGYW